MVRGIKYYPTLTVFFLTVNNPSKSIYYACEGIVFGKELDNLPLIHLCCLNIGKEMLLDNNRAQILIFQRRGSLLPQSPSRMFQEFLFICLCFKGLNFIP